MLRFSGGAETGEGSRLSSAIAFLDLIQLLELRRIGEPLAQLRGAAVRRVVVLELVLDVEAHPEHLGGRGLHVAKTREERARLQVILVLVGHVEHALERVRVVWLACERRAEILLGLLAIAGIQRADARIRIRDLRRLVLEVRDSLLEKRLGILPTSLAAEEYRVRICSCRVIGLELRGLFVMRLGVVASAELIVRNRDHAMRVRKLRIL